MQKNKKIHFHVLSVFILLCTTAFSVAAANFTVNSTADAPDANTADNLCADASNNCTLRAAIQQANATAGADSISFDGTVFASAQTILLTNLLPTITEALTITGTSPNTLTVDGAFNYRPFAIASGIVVSISNLTVANGFAGKNSGGGIFNSGNLTLTNVVVFNNTVFFGVGGGIYNSGTLSISNSSVLQNSATFGGKRLSPESLAGFLIGLGGGIFNLGGTVTINTTLINNNYGDLSGGGIFNGGSSGLVNLTDSTLAGNFTNGSGGAIYNDSGTVNLTSSTIGSLLLQGSSNTADNGGGIYNLNGGVTLTNSTVSGNGAGNIGGGYYGFSDTGTATLSSDSSTIAFNSATNGGGIAVSSATGFTSTATIGNTIISNNLAAAGPDVSDNAGQPVLGTINSTGYNIIQNTSGATIIPGIGDQFGVDPLLQPLANNGGPTETHALGTGSPAIDKGNTGLTTDQRGFPRPVDNPSITPALGGNNSDIGAFEVQIVTAAGVTVSGRITNESGGGISRASVVLTESDGTKRSITTDSTGYYLFEDVNLGQAVVVEVSGKTFQSQTRVVTLNQAVENLDFVIGTKPTRQSLKK